LKTSITIITNTVIAIKLFCWRVYHPGIYPGHSGPLSLAIPSWVDAMSTGNGFGHLWEETVPLKLRPYGALLIQFIKYINKIRNSTIVQQQCRATVLRRARLAQGLVTTFGGTPCTPNHVSCSDDYDIDSL